MKKYGKILVIVLLLLLTFFSFLLIDHHVNKLKAFDVGETIYLTDQTMIENGDMLRVIEYELDATEYYYLLYSEDLDIYIQLTDYELYDDPIYLRKLIDTFVLGDNYYLYLSFNGDIHNYNYKIELEYSLNMTISQGYNVGLNDGYIEGREDGLYTGYNQGYREGYNYGYSQGLQVGKNQGYQEGYSVGENDGYDIGFDEGYLEGKSDGMAITYNYHQIHKVNDNLKDILDLENKKFYDNVGKYVPTDNDIRGIDIINTNTISFTLNAPPNSIYNSPIDTVISNKLPYIRDYNLDTPHFFFGNDIIFIYVNKSELVTFDNNGIKTWLSTNNFTITYKFDNPSEIILTDEEIAQFPSYKIGFNDGYKEAEGTIDGLSKVVPSVFGSIWLVVSDFLSIEIFGISLWSILLLLSGISLLILLLKMVL